MLVIRLQLTIIFELARMEPPINKNLLLSLDKPIIIFPEVKISPFKFILPFSTWVIELLNVKFEV